MKRRTLSFLTALWAVPFYTLYWAGIILWGVLAEPFERRRHRRLLKRAVTSPAGAVSPAGEG